MIILIMEIHMQVLKNKKYRTIILLVCAFVALTIILSGCDEDHGDDKATSQLPVRIIEGPVRLSYKIRTGPGSWESTSSPKEVSEILLFENYVIVTNKSGFTQLFPVSDIVSLNWMKD
jgi:hypothetical protein